MTRYVALVNWTEQGIRNAKDTVKRADAFVAVARRMDCRVHEILWTMGPYDVLAFIDAPNDQTVSALTLSLGMLGNVRTVTMRAYTKEEMEEVLRVVQDTTSTAGSADGDPRGDFMGE